MKTENIINNMKKSWNKPVKISGINQYKNTYK